MKDLTNILSILLLIYNYVINIFINGFQVTSIQQISRILIEILILKIVNDKKLFGFDIKKQSQHTISLHQRYILFLMLIFL
jgi:hypothetical protein